MNHIDSLKDLLSCTAKYLEHVASSEILIKEFIFDCADLADYTLVDILGDASAEKNRFEELRLIKGPTLYWIEIISDTSSRSVYDTHKSYKEEKKRPTPAINNYQETGSRILYVGKVKRSFYGRVIQHLGFHKNRETQGLQLFHWSKPLALKIKFRTIEFDSKMEDIIPIVEYAFAKDLKPIIGKHK